MRLSSPLALVLVAIASNSNGASAFVAPSVKRASMITTTSGSSTQVFLERGEVPYGEESRKFRRTVYTHDDWVKHRSPDRFLRNFSSILTSGVYKNIGKEVVAVSGVATFVALFNMMVGGYVDLSGVQHEPIIGGLSKMGLPLTPFTLSSASLGLLLVFRTNTGYQRWDEARKNWGMNINHTRDLVRLANAYYDSTGVTPEKRKEDLEKVALATWSFVRAMKRHLSPEGEDEVEFKAELYDKLPYEQAQAIIDAAHRPNRALQDISYAVESLPMHWLRKNEIHRAITIFEDNLGSSERLLTSPVPLFYSRHSARFLFFWCALIPIALYEPFGGSWNHLAMIPATAMLSTFLIGIDELANQMEEPFTILPMQAFCDKIYNWCFEISSWVPGDNGMPIPSETKEEHMALPSDVVDSSEEMLSEAMAPIEEVPSEAMAFSREMPSEVMAPVEEMPSEVMATSMEIPSEVMAPIEEIATEEIDSEEIASEVMAASEEIASEVVATNEPFFFASQDEPTEEVVEEVVEEEVAAPVTNNVAVSVSSVAAAPITEAAAPVAGAVAAAAPAAAAATVATTGWVPPATRGAAPATEAAAPEAVAPVAGVAVADPAPEAAATASGFVPPAIRESVATPKLGNTVVPSKQPKPFQFSENY